MLLLLFIACAVAPGNVDVPVRNVDGSWQANMYSQPPGTIPALTMISHFTNGEQTKLKGGELGIKIYHFAAPQATGAPIADAAFAGLVPTFCILTYAVEAVNNPVDTAPANANNCKINPNSVIQLAKWEHVDHLSDVDQTQVDTLITNELVSAGPLLAFKALVRTHSRLCVGNEGAACPANNAAVDCNAAGAPANCKLAIMMLGPSASGKTRVSFNYIQTILGANGVANPAHYNFFTIDGGKMREISTAWEASKRLCVQKPASAGCSNLFSAKFKPVLDPIKAQVFAEAMADKEHIIIIDTGVSANPTANPAIATFYVPLDTAGYGIHMAGVYTSYAATIMQGQRRAFSEGKQYPLSAIKSHLSWSTGVTKIAAYFNRAREAGNDNTFVVVRNKWQPEFASPADIAGACTADIMSHFRCGGTAHTLYPTNPCKHFTTAWQGSMGPTSTDAVITGAGRGTARKLLRAKNALGKVLNLLPGVSHLPSSIKA